MRVTLSKFERVQLPKEGQVNDGLTRNYSGSPHHRFKGYSSKNKSNIYPPSPTLHLSNIPAGVDEDTILEAFLTNMPPGTQLLRVVRADDLSVAGTVIVNFKFFPNTNSTNDKRMALIQFQTVEKAVIALMVRFALAANDLIPLLSRSCTTTSYEIRASESHSRNLESTTEFVTCLHLLRVQ